MQRHSRGVSAGRATALIACALAALVCRGARGETYYVRPDGGTAAQCSGLVDAPYSGNGSTGECAWNHPFQALPPEGAARLAGGDTLLIAAGSYMMGLDAPGAEGCSSDYPWDCVASPVPAGADADHPTRVLGVGYDSGCKTPPELWGTERAAHILDLTGARYVEVRCLEIDDHSPCVEFHSGSLPCQRDTFPYGTWAAVGISATDASNIVLADLNVHGLASTGVHAGRLSDWSLARVRIAGNGWAGWDGDVDGDDANAGAMVFRQVRIEWNGCGETYPQGEPTGCWAQTAGGYGDGLGTGETSGDWLFEDSAFVNNTSDGLDLLYARQGSTITIRRTVAAGNAGNQIKTNGPATIENSVVVGNCAFFAGKAFTHHVDSCRAAGNAVSLSLREGDAVSLANNTLTGEGDCLVLSTCFGTCNGGERVRLRNNLFVGHPDALGGDQTCLLYQEGYPQGDGVFDADYSLVFDVKDEECPGPHDLCGIAPGIANEAIESFDPRLVPGSPAIDRGSAADAPADDFTGRTRDARPDIGAYELALEPGRYPRRVVRRPAP